MRCYRLILSLLLLVSSASSCVTFEGADPVPYVVFDDLLFERKVNFDTMLEDVMAHYGGNSSGYSEFAALVEKAKTVSKSYTIYGITYNTVDPAGQPVKASGLIYMPETARRIKGVIEIVPVNKSKSSCGTINRSVPEAISGCTGYIMIVPDLIGVGSTNEYPISYLQHDNVAQVSVDMRKAAYEFLLNRRGYNIGNRDLLFGYSLGGSGVLALARHYAKHPELGIKVREVWLGAGSYDPLATFNTIIEKGESDYAMLPNICCSMDWYDHLGLNYDELFVGVMKERYQELTSGEMSIHEITDIVGSKLSDYLNMDFFKDDCEGWQKLSACLASKAIPVDDFEADFPFYLYHSVDDTVIPHELSDTLYAHLVKAGATVYYKQTTGVHVGTGFIIEGDFAKHLYYDL